MTTNADREWLRRHAETNFRIRRPAEGELERIFRASLRVGVDIGPDIVPPLDDGHEWRVMVIKLDNQTLTRVPVIRDAGAPDEFLENGQGGAAATVAICGRIVMDRIGG
ncbi:MAG TPA: hypothetical protein VIF88_12490 [Methylocystis sp.]|jgi:hypothetical protein